MKTCKTCGVPKPLSDFYVDHRRGGNGYRYQCKACSIAYTRGWKKAHPEMVLAQYARRYLRDPKAAIDQRWRRRNKEKVNTKNRRQRAQRKGALISDLTRTQWAAIKRAFGYRCAYCGAKPKRLAQDHITPLSAGGSHTVSNVIPACLSCNSKKGVGKPLRAVQPLLLA